MKILKRVIQVIVALGILLAGCGWMISSSTQMDRAIDINTPAGPIYDILITPKEMDKWSPWDKIDPENTTYKYEGKSKGEGAVRKWASDHSDVGVGTQTWIECIHNKEVKTKIEFDGMSNPAYGTFILDEFDGYTEVTWAFEADYGSNPFMHYFTLFTESMLGPSYEEGLSNLKTYVESLHMEEEELDIELEGDALVDSLQHVQ
ncbi:MAG: SRPBCC family protein [Reichenbachiella sp.]